MPPFPALSADQQGPFSSLGYDLIGLTWVVLACYYLHTRGSHPDLQLEYK